MQNLLYSGGSTLFVAPESNHQGTVAHEAVFDAPTRGAAGDLRKYRADRVWKVQASNGGIVTLNEVRPANSVIKLSLKTAHGGVLLVDEVMETENV